MKPQRRRCICRLAAPPRYRCAQPGEADQRRFQPFGYFPALREPLAPPHLLSAPGGSPWRGGGAGAAPRFRPAGLPLPAAEAMAAGGSDPRAADVEEDASQLVFPKGGSRGAGARRRRRGGREGRAAAGGQRPPPLREGALLLPSRLAEWLLGPERHTGHRHSGYRAPGVKNRE